METSPFEAGIIEGNPVERTDACEIHRAANIIHIAEKMIHRLNVLVEMKKVKRDVKRILRDIRNNGSENDLRHPTKIHSLPDIQR